VIVPSAFEALRAHNAGHFDAYVLDYWLPDWSGVGLCRQIRESEPNVPIVFFTAADRDEQKRRGLRAGANVFLHVTDGAAMLASRMRTLLQVSDTRSLQARVEEERVIQEELSRRAAVAMSASEHARERAALALERMTKVRASKAFVEAGGCLAMFERWWGQMYAGVGANTRAELEPVAAPVKRTHGA
jgi:DNA-binding response OmpR family regulator